MAWPAKRERQRRHWHSAWKFFRPSCKTLEAQRKNSESYSRDAETRTPLARLARVSPGIVRRVLQGGRLSSNVIGGCLKVLPSVLQDAGSAKKKTASLTVETPKLERHWRVWPGSPQGSYGESYKVDAPART